MEIKTKLREWSSDYEYGQMARDCSFVQKHLERKVLNFVNKNKENLSNYNLDLIKKFCENKISKKSNFWNKIKEFEYVEQEEEFNF